MWLLIFMILVMPYENSPYLYIAPSFLGIFPDFTVIKLLGLVGFGWALTRIAAGGVPEGVLTSRPARLFTVFFVGVILAGLLSGSGFIAVSRYLAFLTFLPFVLSAVRTHEDLRRVLYAIALSMMFMVPYGLRQMARYQDRFGVALYEPNYLAANLILVILLALAIASVQPTRGRRWLWLSGGLMLIGCLLLSGSRGGFLGLLVAGAIYVYRQRGAGAALGLLGALILVALPTTLGERALGTLLGPGSESTGLEASNQAHVALFWGALRMIADAPLTGVGPYNFKALSTAYSGLERDFIAHNTYLELAAELGLPVLVIFLLLALAVFRGLGRARSIPGDFQSRELAAWAEGLRSGLAGFLVAGAFISAQYEKWFWLVVFIAIAVERLATAREWQRAQTEAPAVAAPLTDLRPA
jgi:O-antigen ligase